MHITFTFLLRNALFWVITHCVLNPEESNSQLLRGGSLKSLKYLYKSYVFDIVRLIYLTNKHELSTDVRTSYNVARFTDLFNCVACYRIFVPKWQTWNKLRELSDPHSIGYAI